MILWTIEQPSDYQRLVKDGVLRADKWFYPDYFDKPSYQWIRAQMTDRVGLPPRNDLFPVRTWAQYQGKRPVDPRVFLSYWPKGMKVVGIEFECPDENVLLCDADLWVYVVNHWYIPTSQADERRFEATFPRHPWTTGASQEYHDEEFQRQVTDSWCRVFDLAWHDRASEITSPPREKTLIGWVWEIERTCVVSARPFLGSGG